MKGFSRFLEWLFDYSPLDWIVIVLLPGILVAVAAWIFFPRIAPGVTAGVAVGLILCIIRR